MTEPLDFSSIGSKTNAPPPKAGKPPKGPGKPPKAARPRPPKGAIKPPKGLVKRSPAGGPPNTRIAMAAAAVALVALVGFLAFGRGGSNAASEAAKSARFCGLATQFDAVVLAAGQGSSATGATGRLLAQMGATVDEMTGDAPPSIRSDVAAVVKAVRQAATGNPAAIQSASYKTHTQHIAGVRQKECTAAVSSDS